MLNSTYFIQECSTCGRQLQIRVEYLGKSLVCEHCQGRFTAADPANAYPDGDGAQSELLRRANDLLQSSTQQESPDRGRNPR